MQNQRRRSGRPPGRTCRTAARPSAGGSAVDRRGPRGAVDGRPRDARRAEHRPAGRRRRRLRPGQLRRGRGRDASSGEEGLALGGDGLQHRALRRRRRRRARVRARRLRGRARPGSGTGEEAWSTDVTATATTGIDIQPVIAGDLVLVSSVPVSLNGIYTGGDRGVVTALERTTGEVAWTFDTVLGDDLWGDPAVNSGGGAWYPPAVDLERGVVYVGPPTRRPFPGTAEHPNGSSRPATTSTPTRSSPSTSPRRAARYHQVTPHDLLDRDQVHTQLVTLEDGDRRRGQLREVRGRRGARPR